jgi:protoheme IX farnesyltransferase
MSVSTTPSSVITRPVDAHIAEARFVESNLVESRARDFRPDAVAPSVVVDWLELTKPKIAALELLTLTVAAALAGLDIALLLHALLGTFFVAGSASALNQWLERFVDQRMERTRNRPLAAGRLDANQVLWVALLAAVAGVAYLATFVGPTAALLGFASWGIYVWIYTPLKTRSSANTLVGAIAGAIPILMGWTAMGAPLDLRALTLFLIVFLWQFPHFMAIAWIYREEYRRAGMKMLPVVDASGVRSGVQAVQAALLLVPVSLVPVLLPFSGSLMIYFVGALALSLGQLACAAAFLYSTDYQSAKRLLRASLVYLPGLLLLLMLATPA